MARNNPIRLSLISLLLFIQLGSIAQENQRTLYLNAGTQNSWERDYAYSPLVYKGLSLGFTMGYASSSDKKTDELYLSYSRLPLQNSFNAQMTGTHASILTYTMYKTAWLPEELTIGWSNNNAVSVRNFEDAQNFNPRFDFHTSFGPALRYQLFFGKQEQWLIIPGKLYHPFRGKLYHLFQDELVSQKCIFY